jgi:hypothetical protein
MTRLVIPVGQFGGAVRRPSENDGFSIRRGAAVVTLEPDPGTLWLAAHGRPTELATTAWTRDAVSDAPAAVWSTLTGLGLLVEIDPDEPEALDFARTHRLVPRMHGLGNRSEHPNRFMAGYAPDGIATFTWHQWRLWRESHLEPSLWDGCERLVENERGAGREVDARALLADTLRNLHIMLGLTLAYLDVAR